MALGGGGVVRGRLAARDPLLPMIVLPLDTPPTTAVVMVRWRVLEVQVPDYDAPSWHLMGFLREAHCAKVSSALAHVSAAGNQVRSKTGSLYALVGTPATDENAARLWHSWQRKHGVAVLRDVTAEVLAGRQPRPVHLIRRTAAVEDAGTSLRGERRW